MGQIFTATISMATVTAVRDIFEIVAPATGIIKIHRLEIGQITLVGDAAEEMLELQWASGHTSSGSGGSSPTKVPQILGDTAGATVEANNTTQALTADVLHYSWAWNVRIPFDMVFAPDAMPILNPSRRAVFALETAPTSTLMKATITWEEIG